MYPAMSVIVFTVLSGAGFGMIVVVGAGYPIAHGALPEGLACGLAVFLAAAGLISSTFHLGHPERAWRAFSQWRSSWLSREGVLSLATLALFSIYSASWIFFGERIFALGWVCAAMALLTVLATAMIYAQLKAVPQWHTALTPGCYLLFSLASGLILSSSIGPPRLGAAPASALCIAALVCAWAVKLAWWRRSAGASLARAGSTRESATGLGHIGNVRLLERPHTGPNYLTREMICRIGRKHAAKVRRIALAAGLLAPAAICALVLGASAAMAWQFLASASFLAGLLAERWLFFAEAEHSVSLYY